MGKIDRALSLRDPHMKTLSTFSPISLRYIAALRGNKPKKTGTEFTYAEASCVSPEKLICLAASNPEGRFYGFVKDDNARRAAEEVAAQRGTFNIIFMVGKPSEILSRLNNGSSLPPMLDFLCYDESTNTLEEAERTALFDLAEKRLRPGGLFARSYRAYAHEDGALAFLVQQLAPEMNDAQKSEFLVELQKLGTLPLAKNPTLAEKLKEAIAQNAPQKFFALYQDGEAKSGSFDTLVAMASRSMLYSGDADLASNYVELVIPKEAQDLILSCVKNPHYEQIKDYALARTMRSDIWVKAPIDRFSNPAELFGGFAYGLLVEPQMVPPAYAAQGKVIDLSSPLYTKVIELMATMPIGVGDVIAHPYGAGEKPEKILEAMQILVACGYASPMRGALKSYNMQTVSQPRFVGSYNRYLDKTALSETDVLLASQVTGCGVSLPASEAFVMQALNRAGLNNSVSALMPELRRIANTPASLSVIHAKEPTNEIAQQLIHDVVSKHLPQWYALALLEAA